MCFSPASHTSLVTLESGSRSIEGSRPALARACRARAMAMPFRDAPVEVMTLKTAGISTILTPVRRNEPGDLGRCAQRPRRVVGTASNRGGGAELIEVAGARDHG